MKKRFFSLFLLATITSTSLFTSNALANEFNNNLDSTKIEVSVENQNERALNGWVYSYGQYFYYKNGTMLKNQWLKDGGNWYYLDDYGFMCKGREYINGKKYYFNDNGSMHIGWLSYSNNTSWEYYGSDGVIYEDQWLQEGNDWYYFSSYGLMSTGTEVINQKEYYFNSNGKMYTGWRAIPNSTFWVYYSSNGSMLKSSWLKENNKWYYFDNLGFMETGRTSINGKYYYFNQSGVMQTNWVQNYSRWYYYNSDGTEKTATWYTENNKTYYFNEYGYMVTGYQTINGQRYQFGSDGVLIKKA